jgi:hypothetical protein
MKYIKLIGVRLGDFSSAIEFEQNYGINESDRYNSRNKELEGSGLVCILTNVDSDIEVLK